MKRQTLKLLIPADKFTLFGFVSAEKDYRICWYLNKALGLDFVKQNDLEFDEKKNSKKIVFSKFYCFDEPDRNGYYLLENKSNALEILLPEWKDMDYLLKIAGDVEEKRIEQILEVLKSLPSVQIAIQIDTDSLKSKENLIFE